MTTPQALMQRSKILLKECSLDEAVEDLTKYAKTHPADAEAQKMVGHQRPLIIIIAKTHLNNSSSTMQKKPNPPFLKRTNSWPPKNGTKQSKPSQQP